MNKLISFTLLACLSVSLSSYTKKTKKSTAKKKYKTTRSTISSSNYIFPVSGKKANIGSFWGEVRGGGTRTHEGIDIFAKKGTPVVAISDGVILLVQNEEVGGKVVRMRAADHSWEAYYAHLDKQKVRPGQVVKKGELIGTVGNTGNAKTTPSHLHFGIYTKRGPVNPLPYVKHAVKIKEPRKEEDEIKESSNMAVIKNITPAFKTASTTTAFEKQTIVKTVKMNSDPAGSYYVTETSDVVRLQNGNLVKVGKMNKTSNPRFPYFIVLQNKSTLTVAQDGKLISNAGQPAGMLL